MVISIHAGFAVFLGMGVIDPDFLWEFRDLGRSFDEAFRMQVIECFECSGPGFKDFLVSVIVDAFRGKHGDPGMVVFGIVPGKELPAEGAGILDGAKAFRVIGSVFQCFERSLGERVIIGYAGAGIRGGYPEIGQELGKGVGFHGTAVIGMDGERIPLNLLFGAGFRDKGFGQFGRFPRGDQPAHDIPAVDVENFIEIEEGPLDRSPELGDIPGPHLVGFRSQEFGSGTGPRKGLSPDQVLLLLGENTVHGAFRTEIGAFIQERGIYFSRRHIPEMGGIEGIQHLPFFRRGETAR